MNNTKRDILVQVSETALKEANLTWQRVSSEKGNIIALIINCGHPLTIRYNVTTAGWFGESNGKKFGKSKGVGIYAAIRSATGKLIAHKVAQKRIKAERKREKNYNKETPANLLFKLKKAEQYYDEGNSVSKSARMANAEYRAVKEHLQKAKKIK